MLLVVHLDLARRRSVTHGGGGEELGGRFKWERKEISHGKDIWRSGGGDEGDTWMCDLEVEGLHGLQVSCRWMLRNKLKIKIK